MSSIDVFLLYPSSLHSFTRLPLVRPLIWLSSLCQSVPLLVQFISPPHSFQMTLFLLSLPPSHQPIVSLPPPPVTLLFPLWTWLGPLVSGLSGLLWFPLPPPRALCFASALSVVYLHRGRDDGGVVGIDWWMARGPWVRGSRRLMDAPVSQDAT